MFLLPVVMRKDAILLRQHAPQTLGSAKICNRLSCFVRTRSGDGAAYGCLIQPACRDVFVIDNIIMNSVRQHGPTFPSPCGTPSTARLNAPDTEMHS
jgi:hypothetical protein